MGFLGSLVGNAIASVANSDAKSMEKNTSLLMFSTGVEPWDAGRLVRNRLQLQEARRRSCALNQVPVELGLSWLQNEVGGILGKGVTRDRFVSLAKQLLQSRKLPTDTSQELDLVDVYQSIDYDGSGQLSVGELAAGLATFFRGTERERDVCVFQLLDRDGDGYLTLAEFGEYLKPLVGAMVPDEAVALKALLLRHASIVLFAQACGGPIDSQSKCTLESFLAWRIRGREKGLPEELQGIIETMVYKVWLQQNLSRRPGHIW